MSGILINTAHYVNDFSFSIRENTKEKHTSPLFAHFVQEEGDAVGLFSSC